MAAVVVGLLAAPPTGLAAVTVPPIGADCSGSPPRQEVHELTDAQWTRYIDAVKTLQQRATPETASAYDQLAFLHHKYASRIHSTAEFFPWHRLFVRTFEYDLQQIDPGVTVPYWDWTRDSRRLAAAPFWSPSLLGGNGTGGRHGVIRDGRFADWIPQYSAQGFRRGGRRYGLARDWLDATGLGTGDTARQIARVLRRADSYEALRDGLEDGAHNTVHGLIGGDRGDMNDIEFSPNDPVFWMHHAFVDKLWADWQNRASRHFFDYGGARADSPDGARLSDRLDGFGDVTVRDVLRLSSLCVHYERQTSPVRTITTLRTSAATVRPEEKVTYIATISNAAGGFVDFRRSVGEGQLSAPLCANVRPVFAVNTWTAACTIRARRLGGANGRATVVATYGGDARNSASAGSVAQRIVRDNPKVLWAPAESVPYGTPLGANVNAFTSVPGRLRFTTLASAAAPQQGAVGGLPVTTGTPETPVSPNTVLEAGYHVLLLRFVPRDGRPQLFTRSFVVTPGTLYVQPDNQRITTLDQTPPLTYTVYGFVAGDTPAELTGFLQPICRAARPEGTSETAPRPAGTYTIFCAGGSALNYTIDTSTTATLEVVEPEDPTAGESPEPVPGPGLGAGPPRRSPKVCTTFSVRRGAQRVYCGGIKRRRQARTIRIERKRKVVARGRARRRGGLLELIPAGGRRLAPGRYRLTLVTRGGRTRSLPIRVIPEARARRAGTRTVAFRGARNLAELCRIANVNIRLGTRRVDGMWVSRWRVVQRPR